MDCEELSSWFWISMAERVIGAYSCHEMANRNCTRESMLQLLESRDAKGRMVFGELPESRKSCFWKREAENKVPVVPAMEINFTKDGKKDGQYFYVFHWIEGKVLVRDEIKAGALQRGW